MLHRVLSIMIHLVELSVSHGDGRFEVPGEKKCFNLACENGNKNLIMYQQKYWTS